MKAMSVITVKSGSQIIEAAICLPIYILSVLILSSIILYYSAAENIVFSAADELRLAALEAEYVKLNPLFSGELEDRIEDENSIVKNCDVVKYENLKTYLGIEDVLILELNSQIGNDIIPFSSQTDYELSIMTREFIGTQRKEYPMNIDEFTTDSSETVYIFPNYGECYHNKNCILVKTGHKEVLLTDELAGKLSPCDMCNSKIASIGDVVYILNGDTNYHIGNCELIKRKYIEVEKITAIKRGYRPCKKCGG